MRLNKLLVALDLIFISNRFNFIACARALAHMHAVATKWQIVKPLSYHCNRHSSQAAALLSAWSIPFSTRNLLDICHTNRAYSIAACIWKSEYILLNRSKLIWFPPWATNSTEFDLFVIHLCRCLRFHWSFFFFVSLSESQWAACVLLHLHVVFWWVNEKERGEKTIRSPFDRIKSLN